jgi:DNA-binding MarR family transcriptional regulator
MLMNSAFADRIRVNLVDLKCMAILIEAGPISAGRLGELANTSTPATALVINRLEAAAVVRRERDSKDRRRVFIHLNHEAGPIAALAKHQRDLVEAMAAVMANYSDSDLVKIDEFINAATAALTTVIEGMRESS